MDLLLQSLHWAWATFEDLWRFAYVIVWIALLAAYARALTPRQRLWAVAGRRHTRPFKRWAAALLLGAVSTGHRERRVLAEWFAKHGDMPTFALYVASSHLLSAYVLLVAARLGRHFLFAYLLGTLIVLALVLTLTSPWVKIPETAENLPPEPELGSPRGGAFLWRPVVEELRGSGLLLLYGFLLGGVIAALALRANWTFPADLAGGEWSAQALNSVFGVILAVGGLALPIGSLIPGAWLWPTGWALAGVVTFWLAAPAAVHSVARYGEWLGARRALGLAGVYVLAALAGGLVVTAVFSRLGLEPLLLQVSPAQVP